MLPRGAGSSSREESSRNSPCALKCQTTEGTGNGGLAIARSLLEDIQGDQISPGAAMITVGKQAEETAYCVGQGNTPPWRQGQAWVSAGGDRNH